jgi:hypothetical protein
MRWDSSTECYQDGPGQPYIWTRDSAQRRIMLKIKEQRPDAVFEAFVNSPPWWMTVSGCSSGSTNGSSDNLKPAYYTAYCQYVTDVCKHYKEVYGIEFRTMELFNESLSGFWKANGHQEGCHYNAATQIALVRILAPMLKAAGLSTVVSASDETNVALSVNALNAYQSAGVVSSVGQWNTHTYSGNNKDRCTLSALTDKLGLPLWMSELGSGDMTPAGNLTLAQIMMNDLNYLTPKAWIDWQYVSPDTWGTFIYTSDHASITRLKNYAVREQITRFIKQGYTILGTNNEQVLAAMNAKRDTAVIVLLNNTLYPTAYRFDLSAFASTYNRATAYQTNSGSDCVKLNSVFIRNKAMTYTAPVQSLTTFLFPVKTSADTVKSYAADEKYLILPRVAVNMCVTAENGKLLLRPFNMANGRQHWSFRSDGNGAYRMVNDSNEVITATASYLMNASPDDGTSTSDQLFTINNADHGCCALKSKSKGTAFDLQNVRFDEGTFVGLYDYGAADNAHRQWRIMRVPAVETIPTTDADDYTSYIINPKVYQTGYSTGASPSGWSCTRSGGTGSVTKDKYGDTYFEFYGDVSTSLSFSYGQTIHYLPTGYYKLSAGTFTNSNSNVMLYALSADSTYQTPFAKGSGSFTTTTIDSIYVAADGILKIGVHTTGSPDVGGKASGSVWCGADNFQLTRLENVHTGIAQIGSSSTLLRVEAYDMAGRLVAQGPDEQSCLRQLRRGEVYLLRNVYKDRCTIVKRLNF